MSLSRRAPDQELLPTPDLDAAGPSLLNQGLALGAGAMGLPGLGLYSLASALGNSAALAQMKGGAARDPGAQLEPDGLFDRVSGEEAASALDGLNALSPEDRAAALDGLDDDAFDNLLEQLPPERWKDLRPLVESASDPKRMLQLWAAQHQGEAADRLALEPEPSLLDRSASAAEARHRNGVRSDTLAETEAEVADEVARLTARGDALTLEDVQRLRDRKSTELFIESEYGVNLTNDRGGEGWERLNPFAEPRPRRVWSEEELETLEFQLRSVKGDRLSDASALKRIERTADLGPGAPEGGSGCGFDGERGALRVSDAAVHERQDWGRDIAARQSALRGEPAGVAPARYLDGLEREVGRAEFQSYPDLRGKMADIEAKPALPDEVWGGGLSAEDRFAGAFAAATEDPKRLYQDSVLRAQQALAIRQGQLGAARAERDATAEAYGADGALDELGLRAGVAAQQVQNSEDALSVNRSLWGLMRGLGLPGLPEAAEQARGEVASR